MLFKRLCKLTEGLVHHFKQQFLVFKQYYMYFHILFYPHMFSNNKTYVFKCMYQTPPKFNCASWDQIFYFSKN